MKLWQKIVALNMFLIISLGTIIGFTVKGLVITSLREELNRQGISLAKHLADRIADPVLLEDYYRTQEAINDFLRTEEDIEYVFVTGQTGRLFVHTFKDGPPTDILSWNPVINKLISIQLLDTEKGFIRDIGLKIFERMLPEVHVGLKETRITKTVRILNRVIGILTIIMTILGCSVSCFLSRRITKPLLELVNFAHSLSKGKFGLRTTVNSKDEVGALAVTFNQLSMELKTYKERMAESFKNMLRTEKLTALGRLSAGLAHELRNPLTSMKVLLQGFSSNPSELSYEDIKVILSEVNQMEEILSRFLKFARYDSFNLSELDINNVIKQVVYLTRYHLKNYKIKPILSLNDLPTIRGDKGMIEQALLNLVMNSIEAMPEGGKLIIKSMYEDRFVNVIVKDTGPGIPEGIRERIFDPFFTTKPDGTGLGLSIVYNIIKIHHGKIDFQSNSKGTNFIIQLPIEYQDFKRYKNIEVFNWK